MRSMDGVRGRMLLVVMLVCVTVVGCSDGGVEYDVLVLVPLSGEREGQGRAQLVGVRTALRARDVQLTSGHTLTAAISRHDDEDVANVHAFYQDTKCDRSLEDEAILNHVSLKSSRRLIVLGGYCETSERHDVTSVMDSLVMRQNLPQVLFDPAPVHLQDNPSPISLRPSIRHAYRHLVGWLSTNNFREVAFVNTFSGPEETKPELSKYLLSNNINISINLDLHQKRLPDLLKESKSRIVLLEGSTATNLEALCRLLSLTSETPRRYVWVLMVTDAMTQLQGRSRLCHIPEEELQVYFFNVETWISGVEVYNEEIISSLKSEEVEVTPESYHHAAFSHDAAALVLETVRAFRQVAPTIGSQQFTDRFLRQLTRGSSQMTTGVVSFDDEGLRVVPVDILSFKGAFIVPTNKTGQSLGNATVGHQTVLDGIPLAVFVFMTSLAFLGVIYTLAIFTFNVLKRNDRMIKMTSPNINLIILIGAMMGYVAMTTLGIDSARVSLETMSKLVQGSTFLLAIGFSLVFGSLFAKAWRVFFIFKNLNANGKNTRDEHLLLGIIILVVADLTVLIPWAIVDPIKCSRVYLSTNYQEWPVVDVIREQDVCSSDLLVMWVLVLFFLKTAVLMAGFYFTYQARHVTLPTLRDAHQMYVLIYTVVMLGLLSLPLLLTPRLATTVKYSMGALLIFAVITPTLTLSFVPKMYYLWMRADKKSQESVRFLFSESLRRTQKHLASCSLCFCLGTEEEDKYAQEVLGSEIETLKRTIKEKDSTIRELTDRLYFGTEKKLHEYISSPRHRPLYRPEPIRPVPNTTNRPCGKIPSTEPTNTCLETHADHQHDASSDSADSSQGSCDSMNRSYSQNAYHSRKNHKIREVQPQISRTISTPLMSLSVRGLKENNSKIAKQIANNMDTPIKDRYMHQSDSAIDMDRFDTPGNDSTRNCTQLTDITISPQYHSSSSPNHDSAIDNNSPSSINSEQQNYPRELSLHPEDHATMNALWNHRGKLDLDAIEQEAMRLDSSHGSKTMFTEGGIIHTDSPYNMHASPYTYDARRMHRNSSYNGNHEQNHYYSPRDHHNITNEVECNMSDIPLYENYHLQKDHNYFSHHLTPETPRYREDRVNNVSQI